MIENVLTNYNIKFKNTQLDHDQINSTKLYYKIYNNAITEPLHKFWFSVPNLKYSNNYSDFKTIRFLMNNKNENISKLINYLKDIGKCLIDKLSPTFSNITIDYPWKESEQYPYIFTFFTNSNTLFIDSKGNEMKCESLNYNDLTYSIIFEISSIKLIPILLDDCSSHTIKFNLALILIREDEKKDLKKYLFSNFVNTNNNHSNCINDNNIKKVNLNSNMNKLPFLTDISNGFSLNKLNNSNNTDELNSEIINHKCSTNLSSNKLIIDAKQILNIKNGLKKVNMEKEPEKNNENEYKSDDNLSNINVNYLEKKNSLKKVKTKEKSLLKKLQKKHMKKKLEKEKELEKELERELERELELELEKELERIL